LNPGTVDFHAEEHVWLLAMIMAVIETSNTPDLIGREIEITVTRKRESVGPQHARIVHERLDFAGRKAAINPVVLVVA
jgi:hypothetical protein